MGSSKFQAGKDPKDKDKRKGKAISSSTPAPEPRSKRPRKLILRDEDVEEEEQNVRMEVNARVGQVLVQEDEPFEANNAKRPPLWDKSQPLSAQPVGKQEALYLAKMKRLKNSDDMMIVEKQVAVSDFKPFGIVDKFKALGWMEALTCSYADDHHICPKAIIEWMSTLEVVPGVNAPRTTTFTGKVGPSRRPMVLSFETMQNVVRFDTLNARSYTYPKKEDIFEIDKATNEWKAMVKELFKTPADKKSVKLIHVKLKTIPKLLATIMKTNIIPRLGDQGKVRTYDLRVLYALMTGKVKYSLKHLIMMNIWESHELHDRAMIPHCRLLYLLMIDQGVLPDDYKVVRRGIQVIEVKKLGNDWTYVEKGNYHILTYKNGDTMKVLREGCVADSEEEAEYERHEGGPSVFHCHLQLRIGVSTGYNNNSFGQNRRSNGWLKRGETERLLKKGGGLP